MAGAMKVRANGHDEQDQSKKSCNRVNNQDGRQRIANAYREVE